MRAKASQVRSSNGLSTWHDTTAYRFGSMCGICGLVTLSGAPDPAHGRRDARGDPPPRPGRGRDRGARPLRARDQRLRVLDLETGRQPVANESGEVVAVFNGELYNYRELRESLAGPRGARHGRHAGAARTSTRSTGSASSSTCDGMFALALWDAPRERLVLARDRLGKKPLVWTRLPDGTLAFASELKALLRLPEVCARAGSRRARRLPRARLRARLGDRDPRHPPPPARPRARRRERHRAGRALVAAASRRRPARRRRSGSSGCGRRSAPRCGGGSPRTCRSARSSPAESTPRSSSR